MKDLKNISKKELLSLVATLKIKDDVTKYGDYLIVVESWDMECLRNYRLIYKRSILTYENALFLFNKNMEKKLRAKLVRCEKIKGVSISIFRR